MEVKVALIQDAPVFFNKEATITKVEEIVGKEAKKGAQLIVFPESFIPGYPRGFTFGTKIGYRTEEGRQLYKTYHKNSINLDTEDKARLEEIAAKNNIYLIMGATEAQNENGSLYCSMMYFSPTKGLLGVHRKIKPTGMERLTWAESDGEDLVTFNTSIGKLGGLICWENYMPLARMAMYQKGVEIYIAPTADARKSWPNTMQHIALEGKCFVLGCNQFITKSMLSKAYRDILKDEPEVFSEGGSVIVSPSGEILAGPLFGEAGVLTATINLEEIISNKLDFDPNGHYNRKDIFEFKVNKQPETKNENG